MVNSMNLKSRCLGRSKVKLWELDMPALESEVKKMEEDSYDEKVVFAIHNKSVIV